MERKKITVFIYLQGETEAVPAGIFTHDSGSGVGEFDYGRKYLERKKAAPVDPVALPLGITPDVVTTNGGLYGAFRDASPDFWGRLVIAAENKTIPETLTEIDFLIAANATRIGNLDFRLSPDDKEPDLGPPHFNRMSEILEVSELIEYGKTVQPHLLNLLIQGSSMGGARPKCTVEWKDAQWIAKFPSKSDSINIPRIEYATMKLASLCGIKIPEIELVNTSEKDIFMTRRFDREKKGNNWSRYGFISSLSLMRWDELDRLVWDYTRIAAEMRRYCNKNDILQLFQRMVFNILIRNSDDHPRNHGFLIGPEGLSLSPAYDIVPSLAKAGVNIDFNLAMSVGERGREASLINALSFSSQFGQTHKSARETIAELLKTVKGWQSVFEDYGVTGKEIDILKPSFAWAYGKVP